MSPWEHSNTLSFFDTPTSAHLSARFMKSATLKYISRMSNIYFSFLRDV